MTQTDKKYLLALLCFSLVLFCLPLYKSIDETFDEKKEIKLAGEWLKNHTDIQSLAVISSDLRIPFYPGLMRDQYQVFPDKAKIDFEKIALRKKSEIIVLQNSTKHMKTKPAFQNYSLSKEIKGKKTTILIFERTS